MTVGYPLTMKKSKVWHILFLVGIFFKGLDGILECIGGTLLLFIRQGTIAKYTVMLFHHELAEDPDDLIANYLVHLAFHISHNTQLFAAVFLLVHGVIKIALVAGLYLQKLWVYPLAEVILVLFAAYQLYRFSHTLSILLLLLTLVDMFIIFLIWIEYKRLKSPLASPLR